MPYTHSEFTRFSSWYAMNSPCAGNFLHINLCRLWKFLALDDDKGLVYVRCACIFAFVILAISIPFILKYQRKITKLSLNIQSRLRQGGMLVSDKRQRCQLVSGDTRLKLSEQGDLTMQVTKSKGPPTIVRIATNNQLSPCPPYTMQISDSGIVYIEDAKHERVWASGDETETYGTMDAVLEVRSGGTVCLYEDGREVYWCKDGAAVPTSTDYAHLPIAYTPSRMAQNETLTSKDGSEALLKAGNNKMVLTKGGVLHFFRSTPTGDEPGWKMGPENTEETKKSTAQMSLQKDGTIIVQREKDFWTFRDPNMAGTGPFSLVLTEEGSLKLFSGSTHVRTIVDAMMPSPMALKNSPAMQIKVVTLNPPQSSATPNPATQETSVAK